MTQAQAQQYHMYGATMHDLGIETYYIVNNNDEPKWYLRMFDEETNKAVWVLNIHHAREFNTKKDAIEFGATTKREFVIEEVQDWIF